MYCSKYAENETEEYPPPSKKINTQQNAWGFFVDENWELRYNCTLPWKIQQQIRGLK